MGSSVMRVSGNKLGKDWSKEGWVDRIKRGGSRVERGLIAELTVGEESRYKI